MSVDIHDKTGQGHGNLASARAGTVADARSVLGHALLAQGRRDEDVASLLTEALPIIREKTGKGSRYTREARERCDAYASSHDS